MSQTEPAKRFSPGKRILGFLVILIASLGGLVIGFWATGGTHPNEVPIGGVTLR